jgi:non-specific serine/threonine protein kinase/serine/threonine-protein kinase
MDRRAEARGPFIQEACGGSEELRQEVESLLAAHAASGDFLETPPAAWPALKWEGQRVGPWLICDRLGHGGMSVVYRARRVLEGREQTAALKVYTFGPAPREVERRFRSELKILATLDHPNITHLLDGGISGDGVPYLAMEMVEGQPLLDYCRSHGFSVNQRLTQFVCICQTVHYAHQRLVVHRDIKPSNILVTPAGEPKLLDFGIARILEPETPAEGTSSLYRAASIHYASPEQLRGGQITTATDIYSLGVLLFELITGERWFARQPATLEEAARAAERAGPPKPSARCKELSADLAVIVAKATRPEAGARYQSADDLAADVERYLACEPLSAKKGAAFYVLQKFVSRHKIAVACTVVATACAFLGAIAFARQARIVERERVRAERRFEETRRLANLLISRAQTELVRIPGALKFRQQMLVAALQNLDALSEDSADSPALARDLALGYLSLGRILGNRGHANIGEPRRAKASYEKALGLMGTLLDRNPGDREAAEIFARAASRLNALRLADRQFSQMLELTAEVDRRLASHTKGLFGALTSNRYHRAMALWEMGSPAARAEWELVAARFLEADNRVRGREPPSSRTLGGPFRRIAEYCLEIGSLDSARQYCERALQRLNAHSSQAPVARHQTAMILGVLGSVRGASGSPEEARKHLTDAVAIVRNLIGAEPHDWQYPADQAELLVELGALQARLGWRREAREALEEAAGLADKLLHSEAASPRHRFLLGRSLSEQAQLTGNPSARCALLAGALSRFHENHARGVTLRSEKTYFEAAQLLAQGCR